MGKIVFDNCSDEQLALLVKSGDYKAFGFLLDRYMPYIVKSASKYKSVIETEDLASEGVLSFYLAIKSFQPEKSSFKSFAYTCVERGILAQYRLTKALKRVPADLISSIEDMEVPDEENPESMLIRKENFKALFSVVKSELSDFEYLVFREFICGKSYKEISEVTGKSQKSVDNALRRAREKLAGMSFTE